jgi:hypothetical protein
MIRIIIFVILLGMSRIGYATMEEDWEKAKSANTISAYEEFLQQYSEGAVVQEAHNRLEELYLQRLKQTEIYTKWVDEQRKLASSDELTDTDLIKTLSRSTGEYAENLMQQALSTACNGQPSDYSAVLAVSGNRLAYGKSERLPDDLKATMPGDFYYAICIKGITESLGRCSYTDNGGIMYYISRLKVGLAVQIREVRTGKLINSIQILGSSPTCPPTLPDGDPHRMIIGPAPIPSDVTDQIRKALEKQSIQKGK